MQFKLVRVITFFHCNIRIHGEYVKYMFIHLLCFDQPLSIKKELMYVSKTRHIPYYDSANSGIVYSNGFASFSSILFLILIIDSTRPIVLWLNDLEYFRPCVRTVNKKLSSLMSFIKD